MSRFVIQQPKRQVLEVVQRLRSLLMRLFQDSLGGTSSVYPDARLLQHQAIASLSSELV